MITQEETIELHQEYWKLYKRFCAKNFLYDFNFSINVYEKCALIFDELGLEHGFTEEFFNYNKFFFTKLARQCKVPTGYNTMIDLSSLFKYLSSITSIFSDNCILAKNESLIGWAPLSGYEIKARQIEDKYRKDEIAAAAKNKVTINHVFFENLNITFDIVRTLNFLASIRKTLLDNGDALELLNERDMVLTISKYFEILSKGVTIEQRRKT